MPPTVPFERQSSHSHIGSLGLDGLMPIETDGGMIGQKNARRAAGIVVQMLRTGRMSGRCVLVAGPSACGKTALAMAMARELSCAFVHLSACELTADCLAMHVRRAVHARLKETKCIYEGEVTGIRLRNRVFELDMRSCKGSTTLRVAQDMYDSVKEEEISVGDVVYVEPACGIIKKIGRCEDAFEYDIETARKVPLPKKDVKRRQVVTRTLSLYDIDTAEETSDTLRSAIRHVLQKRSMHVHTLRDTDSLVRMYVDNGVGEVLPGILFIDECHLLDRRLMVQIVKVVEGELSPLVLLATNRRDFFAREDACELLSRSIIIRMDNEPEIFPDIIKKRAEKAGLVLQKGALALLAQIANEKGLRRALNLLAVMRKEDNEVSKDDVCALDSLYD